MGRGDLDTPTKTLCEYRPSLGLMKSQSSKTEAAALSGDRRESEKQSVSQVNVNYLEVNYHRYNYYTCTTHNGK